MEQFNLRTLLEQQRVVPEIQRDYVWGANTGIIEKFISTLNSAVPGSANIGFLYSYESDFEYHLIDGQQRFTTLILLALYCAKMRGVSNMAEEDERKYKQILRHFSYRVRTTTDTFLNALIDSEVNGFSETYIKSQIYYHEEYRNDRSILSIIKALDTINSYRLKIGTDFRIDFSWLLNNVFFWNFDVVKTTQGEELYISMNSRGEDLTQAEHIKPCLFENSRSLMSASGNNWGKVWDNWEDMFFQKTRDIGPINDAMDRLILLSLELKTKKRHQSINSVEDSKEITLQDIEECADALKAMFNSQFFQIPNLIFSKDFNESSKQLLLSAIATYNYSKNTADCFEEIKRTTHFVENWIECKQITSHESFLEFLGRYITSGQSFYEFCIADNAVDIIYSNHELRKILICARENKQILEDLIMRFDHVYAAGKDLRCIWSNAFSEGFVWTEESLKEFEKRGDVFCELFAEDVIRKKTSKKTQPGEIDNKLLTRALLTIGNYHIWSSGAGNYAFGHYDGKKWPEIMRRHPDVISRFIDKILTYGEMPVFEKLNKIISESLENKQFSREDARFYILKYPESLKPPYEGHNILYLQNSGDWGNFNICVYSHMDGRGVGSYTQMFDAIVSREIDKDVFSKGTLYCPKIGLGIYCSPSRGWDVKWDNNYCGDTERLKTALVNLFGRRVVDDEWTRKHSRFYIPLIKGEEQVELGKQIAACVICLIDNEMGRE